MKSFFIIIFFMLATVCFNSPAQAQQAEVFTAAGGFPFSIGASIKDLAVLDDPQLLFDTTLTLNAAQIVLHGNLPFGPIGSVDFANDIAYAFGLGWREQLVARASFGPVAIALAGGLWSATPASVQPLAAFDFNAEPNASSGWSINLDAAYRLERNLIANLKLQHVVALQPDAIIVGLRPQNRGESILGLGLEWRERDYKITALPMLVFQYDGLGLGAEFTARYAPRDQNYLAAGQVFIGTGKPGFLYGLRGTFEISLPEDTGNASFYAAYEPWRTEVLPVRLGGLLEFNAGPGVLYARGEGGWACSCGINWGIQLGYRLPFSAFMP